MPTKIVELGDEVKEAVTGFVGVVTGIASYITGCDQASVVPKAKKDGTLGDGQWFDIVRLKVVKKKVVNLKKAVAKDPGGPQQVPNKR